MAFLRHPTSRLHTWDGGPPLETSHVPCPVEENVRPSVATPSAEATPEGTSILFAEATFLQQAPYLRPQDYAQDVPCLLEDCVRPSVATPSAGDMLQLKPYAQKTLLVTPSAVARRLVQMVLQLNWFASRLLCRSCCCGWEDRVPKP